MFKNINNTQFEEGLKDKDAVLVDVRTPAEWAEGIIPKAIKINVMTPEFQSWVETQDRDKAYYIYCRSGARSASACSYMASKGFVKLFNLSSGIMGWQGNIEL